MALTEIKAQGVLFDLWGTLAYNNPKRSRADYQVIAQKVGLSAEEIWRRWGNFSEEALRGRITSGEERAIRILSAVGAPLELANEMAQFEYDNRSAEVHFFPGVAEMLAELRQRGYRTCLISNCNYLTPSVVERLGLPDLLDDVILSCQVGLIKPEVEIYQLGASKLNLDTTDCVFVGDGGDNEMDGARQAGCQIALVTQERGHAFRFPAKNYPRDITLDRIADLLNYLKEPATNSSAA